MREKEMKVLIRDCLREYHSEDKKILIDISVLQITCVTYFLYNLIFFGNKIIIFKETVKEMLEIKKRIYTNKEEEIFVRNAGYLLQNIETDKYSNYEIIEKKGSYREFLLENPDYILYLADLKLYNELIENGFKERLNLLQKGMIEVNPFKNRSFKFETIGAIYFEGKTMLIKKKEGVLIKVYNSKGREKEQCIKEVKPRDIVLIRGEKDEKYSFNLYIIVSSHSRNQAVKIIWTDLGKFEKSNKYIDRLPYQYRKIILDNTL